MLQSCNDEKIWVWDKSSVSINKIGILSLSDISEAQKNLGKWIYLILDIKAIINLWIPSKS